MLRSSPLPRWSTPAACAAGLTAALLAFAAARFWPIQIPVPIRAAVPAPRAVAKSEAAQTWETRWNDLAALPNSPERMRAREALLEELARTDPKRALALALAEGNWIVRDYLRSAALRGWGAVVPDEAGEWAISQKLDGDRMMCVIAVLTGAAEHPDDAVRVGLKLCAADATQAGDYGHMLINALIEKTGSFEAAARFAVEAKTVDRQSFLLDSAFYQWAQYEPARAREEFSKISDPKVRDAALKGVIEGWADSDPQQLADFGQALPVGEDRSRVLAVALPEWVKKDPDGALRWINQLEPHPDFDKGIAALALLPSLLTTQPQTSMDLVEDICDPARRVLTLDNVFFRWAQHDFDAAKKYAEATQNPEYRERMFDALEAIVRRKNE